MRLVVALPGVLLVLSCAAEGARTSAASLDLAAFRDPPAAARPWVRWWWPGGDVDEAELRREVRLLAEGGFGGAEVQALDAALDRSATPDELARRRSFGTAEYFSRLRAALDEARAAGIQVDLTLGSGWPPGGPAVAVEKSIRTLLFAERRVQGPGPVTLSLTAPDRPPWYDVAAVLAAGGEGGARFLPEHARLVSVVAAPVTGGERTAELLDFADQVELDGASIVVLTDVVGPDGTLSWDVPPGTWQVTGFFDQPSGEAPIFEASPGGPGWVLDPFDRDEVVRYLEQNLGETTGLLAYAGSPLRAVFVDSLEYKVERFFAADFLAEFERRRGYDPVPILPAVVVPGADNNVFDGGALPVAAAFRLGEDDERARLDWQQTAAELFEERFVATAREWLAGHGLRLRLQAYGANIDVIAAAGAADIPETEQLFAGGADVFLRIAPSAAHLYGRDLASAEALVWMQRDHALTPTVMKAAVDKLFSAGVNHVVYHGFPYRLGEDRGYGEAGWHPFSSPYGGSGTYSELIGETSPFWSDMPALNRYVARCQLALRAGEPSADLLVPYPWLGFPASFIRVEDHWEPLFAGQFDPEEPSPAKATRELATALFGPPAFGPRETWVKAVDGLVRGLHGQGWSLDFADAASLLEANGAGCGVRIRGRCWRGVLVPADTPLQARVAGHIDALERAGVPVIRQGTAAVAEALLAAGIRPGISTSTAAPELRHVRRSLGAGRQLVFLSNPGPGLIETEVLVEGGCDRPVRLDPWTGDAFKAARGAGGGFSVKLPAYGSTILACGLPEEALVTEEAGDIPPVAHQLDGWTLDVTRDDVPGGAVSLSLDHLADWRTIEPLRHSGGPGTYRTAVRLPALPPGAKAQLDLGRVEGVAEVVVNGRFVGRLVVPPFRADVGASLGEGRNDVEVRVTVAARNHHVGKQQGQFAGKGDEALVPAGLLGPVLLLLPDGVSPLP